MAKSGNKLNSLVIGDDDDRDNTDKSATKLLARDGEAVAGTPSPDAFKMTAGERQRRENARNLNSKGELKKAQLSPEVKNTIVHDIIDFVTGDAKILDYKLQYISHTAGYGGENLKGKKWSYLNDGSYRLYVFPETLEQAFQGGGDFALKKTYGSLDSVLKRMPKVEIRSYQQRTLLQAIGGGLGDVIDGLYEAGAEIFSKDGLAKVGEMFANVVENIKEKWKASGESSDSLFGQLISGITPEGLNGDHTALLKLPFIFYYGLASSTTRCYFTLPANANSYQSLWRSNSGQGWTKGNVQTQSQIVQTQLNKVNNGFGDFGISTILTTAVAEMFGATYSPVFNPAAVNTKEGVDGGGAEFEISFALFNDTVEHAKSNIGFIRTLFPLAMWSNVGLFAVSGDLFDVKIKGAMRWLMCTGVFTCKPVGAIRRMGNEKIPDVFQITCQFKSLLPNNLNNYLLGYFTDFNVQGRNSSMGQLMKNIGEIFWKGGGGSSSSGTSGSSGSSDGEQVYGTAALLKEGTITSAKKLNSHENDYQYPEPPTSMELTSTENSEEPPSDQ